MTGTRRIRRSAALAAAGLLVLAGCGSSDSEGTTASTTTASAGSTGGGSTTTTAAVGATSSTRESTEGTAQESTTTTSTSTTTSAGGTGGSTTEVEDSEGRDTETTELDSLADGQHFGYLAGLEEGTVEGQRVQVILFDPVDFLTGDAAVEAARAAGAIGPDETSVPNDYFIVNDVQTIQRLAVVPEASVTTLAAGGAPGEVPSSVSEVAFQPYLFTIDVGNVRGITTVSSISGQYLP